MKSVIVLASAVAVLAGRTHDRSYYEAKFFDWLTQFKTQVPTGERFVHMLENFAANQDLIEEHNAKGLSYTLGHNKFSHLSYEEWKVEVRLGLDRSTNTTAPLVHSAPADVTTLPTSIDWVTKGAVTGVKDQGSCGSCWSFSTTGALEGAYYNKYGSLESFSEQNFVDCDTRANGGSGDHGCNGGLMDNAFSWAKKNGGVCTEAAYPYVSGTTKTAGTCVQSSCTKNAKVAPASYTDITVNSDAAMMSALSQQTVAIAIEADQKAFQLYQSGVFTGTCGTNLDHGVLAVGYGTLSGTDYYKVKNSWGPSWGSEGYILLQRGISQTGGQCGMLLSASYPNL